MVVIKSSVSPNTPEDLLLALLKRFIGKLVKTPISSLSDIVPYFRMIKNLLKA